MFALNASKQKLEASLNEMSNKSKWLLFSQDLMLKNDFLLFSMLKTVVPLKSFMETVFFSGLFDE